MGNVKQSVYFINRIEKIRTIEGFIQTDSKYFLYFGFPLSECTFVYLLIAVRNE